MRRFLMPGATIYTGDSDRWRVITYGGRVRGDDRTAEAEWLSRWYSGRVFEWEDLKMDRVLWGAGQCVTIARGRNKDKFPTD